MTFAAINKLLGEVAGEVPQGVHIAAKSTDGPTDDLYPVEQAAVLRAIDKRKREFAAGRRAARTAISMLGHDLQAIPVGEDRSPIWPQGMVGSIAHTDFAAVGAVGCNKSIETIGIDLEPDLPIARELIPEICYPDELNPDETDVTMIARRIFSAKEAAYKAQYPKSTTIFGFDGFRVRFSGPNTITASFTRDILPFRKRNTLTVRQWVRHGVILSLCVTEKSQEAAT